MAAKKRGLGRGLDALLAGVSDTEPKVEDKTATGQKAAPKELPVHVISRGRYQPRRAMEPQALEELASSIRAQGVMQPIVVRPVSSDRYEIIAGERRWRATQMAGLDSIPVVIKDVPDEAAIAMALIENIQRENLNPIEEAYALQRLQSEFDLTQQEVASAVGKSRSAVANLLRLMNLTDDVRKMLEHGDLEMGHARALLTLAEDTQIEAAKEVIAKAMSVRQTEAYVRKLQGEDNNKASNEPLAPSYDDVATQLTECLPGKVAIQCNAKGKGKLTIKFDSEEALQKIISQIQ
ncbi:MAG: ParB/RepB/Spo0J family partition protein [Pontibacterium sp.]